MFHHFFITVLGATITLVTFALVEPASRRISPLSGHVQVGEAEFCSLDRTWTSGGPRNDYGSQMLASGVLTSRLSFQTERTGFEPAEDLRPHGFSKPALSTTQPPLLIH